MENVSRAKKNLIMLAIIIPLLYLAAGILQIFDSRMNNFFNTAFNLLSGFILISLGIIWCIAVWNRIVQKNMRNGLIVIAGLFIFWMIIRLIKYRITLGNDEVSRFLWYCQYIPQCLAPLVVLLSVVHIGQKDVKTYNKLLYLLYIPATIILLLILTNDYHQQAFIFNEGFKDSLREYKHGWVYYVTIVWALSLSIASIVVLFLRCRVAKNRKKIFIPFSILIVGTISCVICFFVSDVMFKIPELIGITFVAVFESCIQIGFIPSNNDYERFFYSSSISAFIVDRNGKAVYVSKNAPQLPEGVLKCESDEYDIDKNHRLNNAVIKGGKVFWVDELSGINALNDELMEINARLSEHNELTEAENCLKEQMHSTLLRAKLYDTVTAKVQTQLDEIKHLLKKAEKDKDGFNFVMSEACVNLAYVKRCSNLALMGEYSEKTRIEELSYSIREIMEYMSLMGIKCSYVENGSNETEHKKIQLAFDFFFDCIKSRLSDLSECMAVLKCENKNLSLRILTDVEIAVDEKIIKEVTDYNGNIASEKDDGTVYTTLNFEEGDYGIY